MNNIIYKGLFKNYIQDFVKLKQAIGYNYNTEAMHLKRFDKFTLEKYPKLKVLTKEMVLDWCDKKTYETRQNQCSRTSIIRQFGKYLDSVEVASYIIPKGYYQAGEQYVPYIYTDEELRSFFSETDKCRYCYEFPHRSEIMPVIFRMIYMCGLRASEARLLKVTDVDLKNGVLTINSAKNDTDRLVPMSDALIKRCRKYSKKVHAFSAPKDYYFPALGGKPMTLGNLYKNFRRFLWRAKISHGGKGKGPRIHDLRHCFAVNCLKKWTRQGKDLMVYLPVLRTYMGHASYEETAYYLRLTADVFPDITLKIESRYLGIIPQLKGDANETN